MNGESTVMAARSNCVQFTGRTQLNGCQLFVNSTCNSSSPADDAHAAAAAAAADDDDDDDDGCSADTQFTVTVEPVHSV